MKNIMYIDTHCHLNFNAFQEDLDEVISRAKISGVEKIIIPGAKIDSSRNAIQISKKYPMCFSAVGIHPHHIEELEKYGENEIRKYLLDMTENKSVIAIGEIGLDRHRYRDYPEITDKVFAIQKKLLKIHLSVALEKKLPVIFHCREAYDELIDFIRLYNIKNKSKISGVIHCFEGSLENLGKFLNLGFYIGYDGNITYPKNQHLTDLIINTPNNRILTETDSPYLTPLPYRGKRNEPENISYIVKKISEIKNASLGDITGHFLNNAQSLFKI